jgi:hypothetical protein
MVTRARTGDPVPDRGHDARCLMPQYERERRGESSVDHRKVGVADAGSSYPDPNQPAGQLRKLDRLDLQHGVAAVRHERPYRAAHRWMAFT